MNIEETLVFTQTSTQASTPLSVTSSHSEKLVSANEPENHQGFEAELQAFMRAFSADALTQPESCMTISQLPISQSTSREEIDGALKVENETLSQPLKEFVETDQLPKVKLAMDMLLGAKYFAPSKVTLIGEKLDMYVDPTSILCSWFLPINTKKETTNLGL